MKIKLTNAAKADLVDIRTYTARTHGREQAKTYMSFLRSGLKTLSKHPEIGYAIDHIRKGYRNFQIEHHRIFYHLSDTHIVIVAILHESQLPVRHLQRRPAQ